MPRRSTVNMAEDTAALSRAVADSTRAYADGLGAVRVSDIIMEYGGNVGALARELVGIGPGKLPAKGTDERRAYDTQKRNLDRYLAGESGSGKQARKPSKDTQEKLQKALASKRPPKRINFTITGYIGYDRGEWRWRTIKGDMDADEVERFLDAMEQGETSEAYHELFSAYGVEALTLAGEGNPQISLDFQE